MTNSYLEILLFGLFMVQKELFDGVPADHQQLTAGGCSYRVHTRGAIEELHISKVAPWTEHLDHMEHVLR